MSLQSIGAQQSSAFRAGLIALVATLITIVVFSPALLSLVNRWMGQEEYAHGFLIPVVTVWLLWSRRDALRASIGRPVWTGPIIVLLAAAMHVIGTLSVMPNFSQAGFVLALVGIVLGIGGYSLLRPALLPILFLLFAIPVPRFIDSLMSLRLQLISSKLGALFISMFQIPVYLDGNIIDLGDYKIQVVDACSGLRYIYPLLSVSFLAAYMFQAPLWQRATVFLSSIPITIAMNSIRIGLVGVTVDYWGNQAADGLLHSFEGWVVFLACACILMLEIYFLARISGRTFSDVFYLPKVTAKLSQKQPNQSADQLKLATSLLLLCAVGAVSIFHLRPIGNLPGPHLASLRSPIVSANGKDKLPHWNRRSNALWWVSMTTSCRTTRDRTAQWSIFTWRFMLRRGKTSSCTLRTIASRAAVGKSPSLSEPVTRTAARNCLSTVQS